MITGGAEENTLYTVEGLDKNKYDIDIIVGEEFKKNILNKVGNDKFIIIQIKGLKGKLNFLYDPAVLIELINLFKKNNYDIVHTHTTKKGILGRLAARIVGVPIIICGLHGTSIQTFSSKILNWVLMFFEKLTGRFTDAYISVSEILFKNYKEKGIGTNTKYYTVYSI